MYTETNCSAFKSTENTEFTLSVLSGTRLTCVNFDIYVRCEQKPSAQYFKTELLSTCTELKHFNVVDFKNLKQNIEL